MSSETILSIHIPKTAGTTFRSFLENAITNKLFLDYHRRNDKAFYGGEEVDANLDSLLALPERPGPTVIHGHYPVSKYLGRFANPTVVAWMRDPVERVASEYFYYHRRQFPTNPLWVKTIEGRLTLEQFAALPETVDMQSRYLDALALEAFDFVGITELFDESMMLFSDKVFPLADGEAPRRNANTRRRSPMYELDETTRASIISNNILDCAKYQKALELHYRSFAALRDEGG